jgi:hypothetical protein
VTQTANSPRGHQVNLRDARERIVVSVDLAPT